MLAEIQQQNVLLTALDDRDRHGFATPRGQTMAGGQDYIEPLRVAGLVSYVRGVDGRPDDVRADASKLDTMYVPARFFPADVPAADLIRLARDTAAGGGLIVYLFHGVGGDYLPVSATTHRALVVVPQRTLVDGRDPW